LPPVWGDAEVEIHTIGVDVGTTTSHVVLGRLLLEPDAGGRRQGYRVRAREVLRASEPVLTPYQDATRIDEGALAAFVRREIELGGLSSPALDVGALILTGYASLTKNADVVSSALAEVVGDLVTIAAGDKLEAVLSAHGAGSVAYSMANPDVDVLHVDIGGGTTKIVELKAGNIVQVGAIEVGARLVAWNDQEIVSVNAESLRKLDLDRGFAVGSRIADDEKSRLATRVAGLIRSVIDGRGAEVPNNLWLTPRVVVRSRPTVLFSGGVAEYIYGRSTHDHGDMGFQIAQQLQPYRTGAGNGGIRATVIGLAQYTTQVSGATVYVSNPRGLPARNLVVVHVGLGEAAAPTRASVASLIRGALAAMESPDCSDSVLLTFAGQFDADYPTIAAVCGGISDAFPESRAARQALYVSFGQDVALTAGSILHGELDWPGDLVAVDGVEFEPFDRVDIGAPGDGGLVPVTVKRMVFSDASRDEGSQISVVRD
jgi:ethanolamine utilization protein EutA